MSLALAQVNSRGVRGRQALFALFIFITYENMVNLGQNWVEQGKMAFIPLMLSIHLSVTLVCAFVLWVRNKGVSIEFNTASLGNLVQRVARQAYKPIKKTS